MKRLCFVHHTIATGFFLPLSYLRKGDGRSRAPCQVPYTDNPVTTRYSRQARTFANISGTFSSAYNCQVRPPVSFEAQKHQCPPSR